MVAFNKFFSSVLLAVLYASYGNAAPAPQDAKFQTHRTRHLSRDVKVEAFHPPSTFTTFEHGLQPSVAFSGSQNSLMNGARSFVASQLKVNVDQVTYHSGYTAEHGASYAYLKQTHEGVPFANSVSNVVIKDSKVAAFGHSFVDTKNIAPSKPTLDSNAAVAKAEAAVNGKWNSHPTTVEYLAQEDGSVALTHVVQIQNEETGSWVEAFVDAHNGNILSVTDFVADASYKVLPTTKEYPTQGYELLVDPQDAVSSPFGWHSVDGKTQLSTTEGNNVVAYKGSNTNTTTASAGSAATGDLVFDYTYDDTQQPTVANNVNAARVNAFYIINSHHDLTYRYGFTEAAFNFQQNNNGKGGAANDRVLMSVQDSAGTNNADFATPPDGQSGRCRMFRFTETSPNRDGAMENDIPLHEMTHGLTNRMTGGGTGRCLQTNEAGGMGEGWSDAFADWNAKTSAEVPDFILGQYVLGSDEGIRTHPYSTSNVTNPLRYSSIKQLNEVHDIGEVWANMLHNVYAAFVGEYGWSETARTNPDGTEGNIVYLHLFIDALAIQPCNPTLPQARDAWLTADQNRYGGANKCLIWNAFASRGLGVKAANHNDDSSVPDGC